MPYDLIADGKPVALGDRKYLLSPQDLAGLDVLPDLAHAGVASLKIEGRLKSPEYVANITRIYREALDKLQAGGELPSGRREAQPGFGASNLTHATRGTANSRYAMEMAFSRGLYTGWFSGTNNQQLVHGRFGKKRGVYLGEVTRVEGEKVAVSLQGPLKPGDGVVFDAGRPEGAEEGGRVYAVQAERPSHRLPNRRSGGEATQGTSGTPVLLSFGSGDINLHRIHAGDRLWKTSDPELERRLRQSFEGEAPRFQRPISMEAHGLAGKPLTLIARDEEGHVVRLESAMPLAAAEKQPLGTERLRDQLGRLGGTPFRLGELRNLIAGEVMLPVSELNRLRREAVSDLEAQRAQPKRWTLHAMGAAGQVAAGILPAVEPGILPGGMGTPLVVGLKDSSTAPGGKMPPSTAGKMPAATAQLIVLVRNLPQLEAALRCGVETVYCEFEDPKKYREAVALFRSSPLRGQRSELFVAPPRIFKMGEDWTLEQVRSCNADGYLVRNYDHLEYFTKDRRVGDYSLNVANRLTAEYLKDRFRLERVTASYDLNFLQLEALLQAAPPEWFEVTIHQHIPMFHMEHCVFCAFLSNGTDYRNCGRPCDKHDLKLRDRVGVEHPVKADVGCRNTVFNALAQTGAEYVSRMLALGVRHFRVEFLNESPGQMEQTIGKYRQLLRGEITGAELWHELKLLSQLGVTRGQIGGQRSG
jgi:putative protease